MKPMCWTIWGVISADWRPVEKGLNSAIGREKAPGRAAQFAVWEIGPRDIAVGAVGEGVLAGQCRGLAKKVRAAAT